MPAHVRLSTSGVLHMYGASSRLVPGDDPLAPAVAAANERYARILAARVSENNTVTRATQTYNAPTKNKDIQATLMKTASASVQANAWSIYDSMTELVKFDDAAAAAAAAAAAPDILSRRHVRPFDCACIVDAC